MIIMIIKIEDNHATYTHECKEQPTQREEDQLLYFKEAVLEMIDNEKD